VAGAHGSQGMEESCRFNKAIIAYWYLMSMITCKWFGWREMGGVRLNWRREMRKNVAFLVHGADILPECRPHA
jgi:hypothetical protein